VLALIAHKLGNIFLQTKYKNVIEQFGKDGMSEYIQSMNKVRTLHTCCYSIGEYLSYQTYAPLSV